MIDLSEKDEEGETVDVRRLAALTCLSSIPTNLRAGIGVLISHEADRGHGYASEALQLMIELLL